MRVTDVESARHSLRLNFQKSCGGTPSSFAAARSARHGVASAFIERGLESLRNRTRGRAWIDLRRRKRSRAQRLTPACGQRAQHDDKIRGAQVREAFAQIGKRNRIERRLKLCKRAQGDAQPPLSPVDLQQNFATRAIVRLTRVLHASNRRESDDAG